MTRNSIRRQTWPERLCRVDCGYAFVAALAVAGPMGPSGECRAAGRIVISEVMYNPASDEDRGQSEWVEIANVGDAPVVMAGWRLDDEDKLPMDDWGTFTCTLAPGGIAVFVNAAAVDEAQFRTAWDPEVVPASSEVVDPGANSSGQAVRTQSYIVLPVKWGGISNTPGDGNEVLRLLDADNQVMCTVALGNGGDWPKLSQAGGPSVYLVNPFAAPSLPNPPAQPAVHASDATTAADAGNPPSGGGGPAGTGVPAGASAATSGTAGSGWRASALGEAGARECRRTAVYNGRDIGSPGRIPARPAPSATPVASTSSTHSAPLAGPHAGSHAGLSCDPTPAWFRTLAATERLHVDAAGRGTMRVKRSTHASHPSLATCEETLASR